MALKTGLEGKPWYVGLGVGLGVGALLFAVCYWRVLQPMRDDYDSAVTQLAGLQNKIQEGRAAKQELPKFREEVFETMLQAGRDYGDGSPFVSEEYLANRNPVLNVPPMGA